MLNGNGTENVQSSYVTHTDLVPLTNKIEKNTVNNAVLATKFKAMENTVNSIEECVKHIDKNMETLLAQQQMRGWVWRGVLVISGGLVGMLAENLGGFIKFLSQYIH